MAGLTLEMMGLYQSAARAYKMAMYAIEKDQVIQRISYLTMYQIKG